MIIPPDDAEFVLIPTKWLPVLREIARGPFLPIDFPLPIIVNSSVPDNEVWFGRAVEIDGITEYEIIKKEATDEIFKVLNVSNDVNDQPVINRLPEGGARPSDRRRHD